MRQQRQWWCGWVLIILLAGCEPAPKTSAPIAAKVNGDELSVDHINLSRASASKSGEQQGKDTGKRVLEQLINQQLLMQQAIEKKLDSDPKVAQALDMAKRAILAQAYVQKVASGTPKPTPEAITEFYAKNPALFAERRVYKFNQLSIAGPEDFGPKLHGKLEELDRNPDKAIIMRELVAWLQSENVKYRAGTATQSAEQLPSEILPKFHEMKEGDLMELPVKGGYNVVQLAASQTQALDPEKAKPVIEQYLLNRARLELTQNELKRLRGMAKIEYVGEYQQSAGDGKTGAQAGLPDSGSSDGNAQPANPAERDGAAPAKQ